MKQWELRNVTDGGEAVGVAVDVADRVRALEVVRERDEPLRILLEQMPAMVWTTDERLRFTCSLGDGFARLGLAPNQIVGMSIEETFEGEYPAAESLAAHWQALNGEEVAYRTRWSGHTLHCRVRPLEDGEGLQIGTLGIAVELGPDY